MTFVSYAPQGQFKPSAHYDPDLPETDDKPVLAAAAFLIPTVIWLEVNAVGRIFAPELLLMGLFPFLLLTRGTLLTDRLPRTFLMLAFAWLMAQILTDLIRDTPFRDFSRGWSKIVFTSINFASIYMLVYGSRKRITMFALGIIVGGYLSFLINPSDFAARQPWKFGLGIPTIMLVLLLTQWRPIFKVFSLPTLLILAVGVYSMVAGSRSMAGIAILTALYVFVQQMLGRKRTSPSGFSPVRTFMFFAGGLMIATTMLNTYQFAASNGMLGELAQETYARQSAGSFGILLGGRSEIFVSSQAVWDSPIIGHGSWAKNREYVSRIYELERYGYDITYFASEEGLIPTHSHLMGAWVESGIMGAIFWVWVLVLIFRVLSNLYMVREPLSPIVTFIGFLMLWDILFSPFGAARRVTLPFNVVMMMFVWEVLRSSVPKEMLGGIRHRTRMPRNGHPQQNGGPNGAPNGVLDGMPPNGFQQNGHPPQQNSQPQPPAMQGNRQLPPGVRPGPRGTAPRPGRRPQR
tara:strand:+ start:196035 stop:197591 length:1557 start_codon:yes stop_codon:yes gene_type:complete